MGWSAAAPGDLNGDGRPDYVAGAPYADVGRVQDQGRVVFFVSR
ncbi:MAG: integrin alpha [Actinobacteria bacterium]|nr:integrin alpha [Actinomycetota bacterium]